MPVRIDASFDLRTTSNFAPMIEQWGTVPVAYLQQLSKKDYSYGYIGSEDLTMDPILPPGSFIQWTVSEQRAQRRLAVGVRAAHLLHQDPGGPSLQLVYTVA